MDESKGGVVTGRQLLAVGLAGAALGLGLAAPGAAERAAEAAPVDVVVAVDTSGSMRAELSTVRADLTAIADAVQGVLPDARFALVAFADLYHEQPEYAVVQPLTADRQAFLAALAGLKTKGSKDARDTSVEATNVVLRQSTADAAVGWRQEARKIVVVATDAEPYGARTAGLKGCRDKTADPHGHNTATELKAMSDTGRTLVMLVSETGRLKLECAASLAEGGHRGGTVLRLGEPSIASTFLTRIQPAFVSHEVSADLPVARIGGRLGLTVRLTNPNGFPFSSGSLRLSVPPGLAYDGTSTTGTLGRPQAGSGELRWTLPGPLPPGESAVAHVAFRADRTGLPPFRATVVAGIGGSWEVTAEAAADVQVVRALALLGAAVDGTAPKTGAVLSGRIQLSAPTPEGSGKAGGTLVVRTPADGVVRLEITGARLPSFAAPTRMRLTVRIKAARRVKGCAVGMRGTADIVDSAGLQKDGRTLDRAVVRLPRGCAATGVWSHAGDGEVDVRMQVPGVKS